MKDRSISEKGADKAFELSFPGFDSASPFAERSASAAEGRGDASALAPKNKKDKPDVRVGGVWEGLPYKGTRYSFKNDDPDHMKPQLAKKANVQIFMLDKEEDLARYSAVMQQVCDGTSQISVEEREYDKDAKSWRILLRWVDLFYKEPAHIKEQNYVAPKAK